VTADSFNKDRVYHAGDQSQAEVFVFDTVLSEVKRLQVEAFLNKKWFGVGNGAGNVLPGGTAMTLVGNATLDLSGEQQQTFASLASTDGIGSTVYLGNAKLTVSNAVNTTFAGVISGNGGSLVKLGTGMFTLSGTNTYGGSTLISGGILKISGNALKNPVAGAARWFDASALALTNGAAITQWNDLSGTNAHAVNATGTLRPTYATNALGELGAVHCNRTNGAPRGDYLNFNAATNIRTVFSVFKGSSFLLTDTSTYNFHRQTDNNPSSPMWASNAGWASDYVKNGSTYVNGALVNGLTYAMPTNSNNGFNLVEVLTTGNVTASSFNNDRNGTHSGDQYHGEVLLYDFLLTESQRLQVENYLKKKWFEGVTCNGTLPSLSPVTIMNGSALDLTSVTNTAIGSLSSTDGLGSRVLLGSRTVLSVGGNNDSTAFDGVISGGGSLTKSGTGTLTLTGRNTFSGTATVSSGALVLGGNGVLSTNSSLALTGGTLNPGTSTNVLQRLSVTGAATITLGAGSCNLTFADSSSAIWTGTLTLTGALGPETLRFGTGRTGLTQEQLGHIIYGSQKFRLDSRGYLFRLQPGTLLSIF
jgi:autotransporter-associated beta strand protein